MEKVLFPALGSIFNPLLVINPRVQALAKFRSKAAGTFTLSRAASFDVVDPQKFIFRVSAPKDEQSGKKIAIQLQAGNSNYSFQGSAEEMISWTKALGSLVTDEWSNIARSNWEIPQVLENEL